MYDKIHYKKKKKEILWRLYMWKFVVAATLVSNRSAGTFQTNDPGRKTLKGKVL